MMEPDKRNNRITYKYLKLLKEGWCGVLLAALIGMLGYGVKAITKSPLADPLLVAMVIGIIVGTTMPRVSKPRAGFVLAPAIFIPIGIVFYAINNLNFVRFAKVEPAMIVLLVTIILVYFAVILILGRLLKQKQEITYLTATGSAICGASAIAITSPAVEAESDDVSISLLAVAFSAVVGLFVVIPFFATLFNLSNGTYGLLSGSVLQITGFVKAAVRSIPFLTYKVPAGEIVSLALSVKAIRYLGLLIAIPLFASLVRRRLYIPWILWIFLGAGLVGTWIYASNESFYIKNLVPFIKPIYNISWSMAMAAIGLNADARQLLSNNGAKALIMAFSGFIAATATFFIGLMIIH